MMMMIDNDAVVLLSIGADALVLISQSYFFAVVDK